MLAHLLPADVVDDVRAGGLVWSDVSGAVWGQFSGRCLPVERRTNSLLVSNVLRLPILIIISSSSLGGISSGGSL